MRHPTLCLAAVCGLLIGAGPAAAQTAQLVFDANTSPTSPEEVGGYAPPTQLAAVGERLVFLVDSFRETYGLADPGGPQATLWASDGSTEGTELLYSFCLETLACSGRSRMLGRLGDTLLFEVSSELGGPELWRTDGTRAGTYRLHRSPCLHAFDDLPSEPMTAFFADRLVFSASEPASGCEPWTSDGTVEGTAQLADLMPGETGSDPSGFTVFRERLFFAAADFAGRPLWVSDATARGTSVLARVPWAFLVTAAESRLFFAVLRGASFALWASDGTAKGTRPLVRRRGAALLVQPDPMGVLLVAADTRGVSQVWSSDGTAKGTRRLSAFDRQLVATFFGGPEGRPLVRIGDRILFPVERETRTRTEIWTTRGDLASTAPLSGCPGGCPAVESQLHLLPDRRRVVFAGAGRDGSELWVSDGTPVGTRQIGDLCRGACSSRPTGFMSVDGVVYFVAADETGPLLWRTQGTLRSTRPLARVDADLSGPPGRLGDRFFFGARGKGVPSELWTSDGTETGTFRLKTFGRAVLGSSNPVPARLGDEVAFAAFDGTGESFFATDGTATGTRKLVAALDVGGGRFLASPVSTSSRTFAFIGTGIVLRRLLATDGSPEGTSLLAGPELERLAPESPFVFEDRFLFFGRDSAASGFEQWSLWTSEGTPGGTVRLVTFPHSAGGPQVAVDEGAFFFVLDGSFAPIYQSDGTPEGTARLGVVHDCFGAAIAPQVVRAGVHLYVTRRGCLFRSEATGEPELMARFDNARILSPFSGELLFFAGSSEDGKAGLWITDSSAAGASFVAPLAVEPYEPLPVADLGSRLLFRGWGKEGRELWVTDGTPGGTTLLADVFPGPSSSHPAGFVVSGSKAYFAANDGEHGAELWVTDGTAEGTRLVADIAPGPYSSSPSRLVTAGERLFFSADDGEHGRELWTLPLTLP